MTRTLVFGAGWIGTELSRRLPDAALSTADIADPRAVEAEIDRVRPDRVVNAAGKNGHPNVDACEDDPDGTYRSNVVGPVVLAAACHARGIHFTHLSSGCIYQGDAGGRGFAEDDPPNFSGSLYSRTKAEAERALAPFGALVLRLRMPVASVPHPRNLLTKLLGFRRVVRVPNSVTVLDDAWATTEALIRTGRSGTWNLVNDGVERHDELLALWRDLVDPSIRFEVLAPEALAGALRVPRSNCTLSTAKLHAAGLALPPVSESLPRVVRLYARAAAALASGARDP